MSGVWGTVTHFTTHNTSHTCVWTHSDDVHRLFDTRGDSQEPINCNDESDVISRKSDRGEYNHHGDQARLWDAGRSDTRCSCCNTGWGETWSWTCLSPLVRVCWRPLAPVLILTWWWWSDRSSSPCCWPVRWRGLPGLHTELFHPCWWWHPRATQTVWFAYQFCCSPPDIWRWLGGLRSWEMKKQKETPHRDRLSVRSDKHVDVGDVRWQKVWELHNQTSTQRPILKI